MMAKMRRMLIASMAIAIVLLMSIAPFVSAEAAETPTKNVKTLEKTTDKSTNAVQARIPKKVRKALRRAVNENGRVIVVDFEEQKMYLFKQNKRGEWVLKKIFECVAGDYLEPSKHFFLLRSQDLDQEVVEIGKRVYKWCICVDCYEEISSVYIHSYPIINGRERKSPKKNYWGIALSDKDARYIYKYYGDGTAVMGAAYD